MRIQLCCGTTWDKRRIHWNVPEFQAQFKWSTEWSHMCLIISFKGIKYFWPLLQCLFGYGNYLNKVELQIHVFSCHWSLNDSENREKMLQNKSVLCYSSTTTELCRIMAKVQQWCFGGSSTNGNGWQNVKIIMRAFSTYFRWPNFPSPKQM